MHIGQGDSLYSNAKDYTKTVLSVCFGVQESLALCRTKPQHAVEMSSLGGAVVSNSNQPEKIKEHHLGLNPSHALGGLGYRAARWVSFSLILESKLK
jgi:hypothetical protein